MEDGGAARSHHTGLQRLMLRQGARHCAQNKSGSCSNNVCTDKYFVKLSLKNNLHFLTRLVLVEADWL